MTKPLSAFVLLLLSANLFAQNTPKKANKPAIKPSITSKDTVIESDTSKENKEPQYFYLAVNANVFVNSKGGFAKRFSPSLEFGRTYGIFDVGISTGKINNLSNGSDTTQFIEFRPTINIFSKGRFSEALCLGGGYVFGAQQALMTEICNSINFNITEKCTISVLQGYYYFDGTNSARGTQFMGFNFTYNLLKNHGVNIQRKKAALVSDK